MGLIKDCDCELQREDFDCLPTSMRLPWGRKVHDILYKDFWHVFYSLFLYFKRRSINSNYRQFIELFSALFTSSFLLVSLRYLSTDPSFFRALYCTTSLVKMKKFGLPFCTFTQRETPLFSRLR